jgi:hypothetical protein
MTFILSKYAALAQDNAKRQFAIISRPPAAKPKEKLLGDTRQRRASAGRCADERCKVQQESDYFNSRHRKIFKEYSSGWPKINKGHTQLRSMGVEKQE